MIIIPSGNSATFTLAANNQLTVTSRGGTTVTGPGGLLGTIDGTRTFGGYSVDTIITIAAVGNDCEYGVTEPDAATLTTDANNNPVLGGAAGINRKLGAASGLRTLLLGHSYLDEESSGDINDYRTHLNATGTINWANFYLGQPFRIVKKAAIGGERVSDVLARLYLVEDLMPQIVFMSLGVNDLKLTVNPGNSKATGLPYVADAQQSHLPYVLDQYEQIITRLQAMGCLIVLLGESSPGNGAADQTKHLAMRTIQMNQWMQRRAFGKDNIVYIPTDRIMYDPLSAAGNIRTGYYEDTIHPSMIAARLRGQMVAARIKPHIQHLMVDRLPCNVLETYSNMKTTGTSLSCDGTTLTVQTANVSGSNQLLRVGDRVALSVPVVGQQGWNKVYTLTAATTTSVSMACAVAGSYTGTINMSMAKQMFDNPLFATQSGGSFGGGGTLTSGLVPSGISMQMPTGSSVAITYSAHTDLDGVADGLGSWCEFDFVGGANADIYIFALTHRHLATSTYTGRLFPGDVARVACDLELMSTPTPSGISDLDGGAWLSYKNAAGTVVNGVMATLCRPAGDTTLHPNVPMRGALETMEWSSPSGGLAELTTYDGYVRIKFTAAGGVAKIRIGRLGVIRVDNPERDVNEPYGYA